MHTGQVNVQFTLKVVIIVQTWYMHTLQPWLVFSIFTRSPNHLVYAYIIALASILNIYQITKSARHLSLHIKQTTFGVYKSCW